VTSGDPTAPKPTVVSRHVTRAVGKKPGRPTATNGSGARSSEPRVSVSKAGAGALKRITKSGDAAAANEDVLERLARLGDAPAPPAADEVIELPEIVEADPTSPPLERPPSTDLTPDQDAPAALVSPHTDSPAPAVAAVALTASSPASMSAGTVVSADLPTAAAPLAPVAPVSPGAQGAAAATTLLEPVAPAAPSSFAPGHTEISPVVAPVVPTEPPVPFEPAVVPMPEAAPAAPGVAASSGASAATSDGTGGVTLPLRRLRTPVVFRRARPRVRRVTRVVRHVDTWSVFKVALVFNVILYLCCLTSGVLLWNVAHATGTIDNIEKFFEQFGWESFEFKGGEIYHNAWIGGLFVAIGLTGFAVLVATLFNLITDLVGGIRVSVLEEEVIAKPRQGDPTGGMPRP
jgi:hypothetical protein